MPIWSSSGEASTTLLTMRTYPIDGKATTATL